MIDLCNPVAVTQKLIRCPSLTPDQAGGVEIVADFLKQLDFAIEFVPFDLAPGPAAQNLYARLGRTEPVLCFAGHTDVVPPGHEADWRHAPFGGVIDNGVLFGRGVADMKGGIAAFISAIARLRQQGFAFPGSLSMVITGDEEGPAINGTRQMVPWMIERGESFDACIVGEPVSIERLGDILKIGARGSLTGTLVVEGIQGHVGYAHRARNPVHPMVKMLADLVAEPLDAGSALFEPSSIQITTVDVGNPTSNVIPARATATFNIRFNDCHEKDSLEKEVRQRLDQTNYPYHLSVVVPSERFATTPGRLTDIIDSAIRDEFGYDTTMTTGGGTSDARFLKDIGPVVELGLVGTTMHQIDERVAVTDLEQLTRLYATIIQRFFSPEIAKKS